MAAAAVVGVLLPGAAQSRPEQEVLLGIVGTDNGQVISLTREDGTPVTVLEPGEYTIRVSDRSGFHNFVLLGAGIQTQMTTVPEVGDKTWTVTLAEGAYAFLCQPHPGTMKGTFVVRATPAPAATKVVADLHSATAVRGAGIFAGSIAGTKLTWRMTLRGLSGRAVAAHIHFPTGRIAAPLCGPCRAQLSGTRTLPTQAAQAVVRGGAYVNVHTKKAPGGEIRGALVRVP
jgi:CHRD domain/Copper binding proteins, plastocyanin/azurin family